MASKRYVLSICPHEINIFLKIPIACKQHIHDRMMYFAKGERK